MHLLALCLECQKYQYSNKYKQSNWRPTLYFISKGLYFCISRLALAIGENPSMVQTSCWCRLPLFVRWNILQYGRLLCKQRQWGYYFLIYTKQYIHIQSINTYTFFFKNKPSLHVTNIFSRIQRIFLLVIIEIMVSTNNIGTGKFVPYPL